MTENKISTEDKLFFKNLFEEVFEGEIKKTVRREIQMQLFNHLTHQNKKYKDELYNYCDHHYKYYWEQHVEQQKINDKENMAYYLGCIDTIRKVMQRINEGV